MGKISKLSALSLLTALALVAACGDEDETAEAPCDPALATSCGVGKVCKARADAPAQFECVVGCTPGVAASCAEGLVCEQLGDTRTECLAPIIVSGRVLGALDGAPIAGATVVALNPDGAARTRVVQSGVDGRYELPVSIKRKEDGAPVAEAITLRAAAADHQPFPKAPRTALPIELGTAVASTVEERMRYRVENAATDISLIALPAEQRGGATVSGVVESSIPGGVLVLAVVGGAAQASAISDQDGAFVLFNVLPGTVTLEAYRVGIAVTPQSLSVPAAGVMGVRLTAADAQLASVSGSVSIVNAAGGLATSVILVVSSTFDANAVRGEAPVGLRAAPVSGAFTIPGVPPGKYAVLAAFENDELVRDPDEGIGGTAVQTITVDGSGAPVALSQGFKVTGALALISPGASGVEEVPAGIINLKWADDSSEDGYELKVYDALGTLVHMNGALPGVSGSEVQYALDATAFAPGMLYQYRVWSVKNRQSGRTYISASEDLKGVFQIVR